MQQNTLITNISKCWLILTRLAKNFGSKPNKIYNFPNGSSFLKNFKENPKLQNSCKPIYKTKEKWKLTENPKTEKGGWKLVSKYSLLKLNQNAFVYFNNVKNIASLICERTRVVKILLDKNHAKIFSRETLKPRLTLDSPKPPVMQPPSPKWNPGYASGPSSIL